MKSLTSFYAEQVFVSLCCRNLQQQVSVSQNGNRYQNLVFSLKKPYPTTFWSSWFISQVFIQLNQNACQKEKQSCICFYENLVLCQSQAAKGQIHLEQICVATDLWFNLFAAYFKHFCSYLSIFGNCQNRNSRYFCSFICY